MPAFWLWFKANLDHWQTLATGFLALGAGVLAYRGARLQVRVAREQIRQFRDVDAETARRKLASITWAVRVEATRVLLAAEERQKALQGTASLPPIPGSALAISVLPLLRGERPDIALCDQPTQMYIAALVSAVDRYNAHIETQQEVANRGGRSGTFLGDNTRSLISKVIEEAQVLSDILAAKLES